MTRKASGGDARELTWFKSSYSASDSNDCVEVAAATGAVLVRDSKDTALPGLATTARAWVDFVTFAARR
jgi:hypothetical protein